MALVLILSDKGVATSKAKMYSDWQDELKQLIMQEQAHQELQIKKQSSKANYFWFALYFVLFWSKIAWI